MRFFVFALAVMWYCGCGENKRDNPADPEAGGEGDEEGIQLVANLPAGGFAGNSSGLEAIRFEVSGPDITRPLEGTMNLVGDEARALVRDVPIGTGRIFRVDAFDANSIRTFSAADTVDVTFDCRSRSGARRRGAGADLAIAARGGHLGGGDRGVWRYPPFLVCG